MLQARVAGCHGRQSPQRGRLDATRTRADQSHRGRPGRQPPADPRRVSRARGAGGGAGGVPGTGDLRLPAAGSPFPPGIRAGRGGLARGNRGGHRRRARARGDRGAERRGRGPAVLQLRGLLPERPRRGDGAQVPAADLRRVRRGPLLRGGDGAAGAHARGAAHRRDPLRGHLDQSPARTAPLPGAPAAGAAGGRGLRPDGEPFREPVVHRQGGRAPATGGRGRGPAARLPGGLRERGGGQR